MCKTKWGTGVIAGVFLTSSDEVLACRTTPGTDIMWVRNVLRRLSEKSAATRGRIESVRRAVSEAAVRVILKPLKPFRRRF